jgi:hypothetical protein
MTQRIKLKLKHILSGNAEFKSVYCVALIKQAWSLFSGGSSKAAFEEEGIMGFSYAKRSLALVTLLSFWISTLGPIALAETPPPAALPKRDTVADVIKQMSALPAAERKQFVEKKAAEQRKKAADEGLRNRDNSPLAATPGSYINPEEGSLYRSVASRTGIKITKSWEVSAYMMMIVAADLVGLTAVLMYMNSRVAHWEKGLSAHEEANENLRVKRKNFHKAAREVMDAIGAMDETARNDALAEIDNVEWPDARTKALVKARLERGIAANSEARRKASAEKREAAKTNKANEASVAETTAEAVKVEAPLVAEQAVPPAEKLDAEPTIEQEIAAEETNVPENGKMRIERARESLDKSFDELQKISQAETRQIKFFEPNAKAMEPLPPRTQIELAAEGTIKSTVKDLNFKIGSWNKFRRETLAHLLEIVEKGMGKQKHWFPLLPKIWWVKTPIPRRFKPEFGLTRFKWWPSLSDGVWKNRELAYTNVLPTVNFKNAEGKLRVPIPFTGRRSVRATRIAFAGLVFIGLPVAGGLVSNYFGREIEAAEKATVKKQQDLDAPIVSDDVKLDREFYDFRHAWRVVMQKYPEAKGFAFPLDEGESAEIGLLNYKVYVALNSLAELMGEEKVSSDPEENFRRTVKRIIIGQQPAMLKIDDPTLRRMPAGKDDQPPAVNFAPNLAQEGVPLAPPTHILESIISEIALAMRHSYDADRPISYTPDELTPADVVQARESINEIIRNQSSGITVTSVMPPAPKIEPAATPKTKSRIPILKSMTEAEKLAAKSAPASPSGILGPPAGVPATETPAVPTPVVDPISPDRLASNLDKMTDEELKAKGLRRKTINNYVDVASEARDKKAKEAKKAAALKAIADEDAVEKSHAVETERKKLEAVIVDKEPTIPNLDKKSDGEILALGLERKPKIIYIDIVAEEKLKKEEEERKAAELKKKEQEAADKKKQEEEDKAAADKKAAEAKEKEPKPEDKAPEVKKDEVPKP